MASIINYDVYTVTTKIWLPCSVEYIDISIDLEEQYGKGKRKEYRGNSRKHRNVRI